MSDLDKVLSDFAHTVDEFHKSVKSLKRDTRIVLVLMVLVAIGAIILLIIGE
jgi:hypothetical protein